MKYMNTVRIFALLVVLIFSAGVSTAATDLKSSKPRYAEVVIVKDAPKAISVIFDESNGTGKGYDTVYADINMDGVIEQAEKIANDPRISDVVYSGFKTVNIPSLTVKGQSRYDVEFICYESNRAEMVFALAIYATKYLNSKPYNYTYYADLNPSTDPKKPFILNCAQPTSVKLDVKPDGKDTGIGIELTAGKADIYSSNVLIDLVIKNSSGKIIKSAKGDLEKFAFG